MSLSISKKLSYNDLEEFSLVKQISISSSTSSSSFSSINFKISFLQSLIIFIISFKFREINKLLINILNFEFSSSFNSFEIAIKRELIIKIAELYLLKRESSWNENFIKSFVNSFIEFSFSFENL